MLRIRKGLLTLAVLAAVVAFAAGSPARAGYTYEIFDDGVSQTGPVTPSGNAFATTITTTHFSITIASSFTTPGPVATVLDTNLQAQLNGSGGTHTIKIELSYAGYTLPASSPLNASSSASATFTNSLTTDHAAFQAWGVAGTSTAFENGATGGQQSATSPGGSTAPVVEAPTQALFQITNPGTFSLSQTLSITLGGGNTDAAQNHGTTTITGVPAPAGLVLALTGLPVLGIGGWLRRRIVRA